MAACSDDSDKVLLVRFAREGDESAMLSLVERHEKVLSAFLAGWCDSPEDAQDTAQDAWIRVMRSPDSFKGGSFRAWLLKIARNLVLDRARKRKPDVFLDAPVDFADGAPSLVDILPDASASAPDEILLRKENREILLKAVRSLPPAQKEVLLMRTADVQFSEIASHLGISINTALGRMHYAMKALRRELANEDLKPKEA